LRRLRIVLAIVCVLLTLGTSAVAVIGGYPRHARAPAWFGAGSELLRKVESRGSESYRFAVLGDIQQGHSAFRAALSRVRDEGDLAFAVVCGDLVNRKSLPHYRVLFTSIESADPGVPVLTVPGNHDHSGLYEKHLGPRFWWARVGPDLIASVDTSEIESPGPMLEDLAKALATDDVRHRFVFLHRPTARPGRIRAKFATLAKVLRDGKVDAVFAGHLHHYESFTLDGALYVTNGRGGDLTGGTTSEASFALVTVTPEGTTAAEVKLGRRSELLSLVLTGMATRIYEPLGGLGVFLVAVFLAAAAILVAPTGGRNLTTRMALACALPATGLPILLVMLGFAALTLVHMIRPRRRK